VYFKSKNYEIIKIKHFLALLVDKH